VTNVLVRVVVRGKPAPTDRDGTEARALAGGFNPRCQL